MKPTSDTADREIVITRVFNAPRKLVWDVWTRPAHISQWWGPRGFNTTVDAMDLRPGGRWRYVMHGPDGSAYPVEGVFREVVPFERIVTTDEFPADFKPPVPIDLPRGIVVTALFADEGEKTRLTLRIVHATVEDKKKHEAMGVVGGWQSSFDCMDDYLAALTDEAKVRQLITDQMAAVCAKDLDRVMSFYAPGAVVFDVKPPFQTRGADEWRKIWAQCMPYFPDSAKTETRDLVVTIGGTAAFAHWLFRFITPDPNHPAAQTWMRLTGCYQKINDEWHVVHEHCSVPFDPYSGRAVFALEV
jgi:uncharacterized protein YndB with AHSA1/START domain/ketosteroid isomerase-like protein